MCLISRGIVKNIIIFIAYVYAWINDGIAQ